MADKSNKPAFARITMNLSEESYQRLEAMHLKNGVDFETCIKDAIKLYEAMTTEVNAGSVFFIQRAGRPVEPYAAFLEEKD